MKNVLLFTGKKVAMGNDVDGGSIVVEHTIDSIKKYCNLDVIIKSQEEINYCDKDLRSFKVYKLLPSTTNKFIRRLQESQFNKQILKEYPKYDTIIVHHVSSLFGTDDFPNEFWKKVILFPMFMTSSYIKSNEIVPKEYIEAEKKIMSLVKNIITPSIIEKEEISTLYGNNKNLVIIPRGVTKFIKFFPKEFLSNKIKLINIGSIKKQKNQLDSLKVLKGLLDEGIEAELIFVTTNQDNNYSDMLTEYIVENNLQSYVKFYFSLTQQEVAEKIQEADFNISTSNWETFGRGIYEGVCAGRFTFILDTLVEVKRFINENKAIILCKDYNDMVNNIRNMISQYNVVLEQSKSDFNKIISMVSYDSEADRLRNTILDL